MNTETTILAAIVLAIIIVAAVFAAVQGSIGKAGEGVGNITDRTDKGSDGKYDFTAYNSDEETPPRKAHSEERQEVKI